MYACPTLCKTTSSVRSFMQSWFLIFKDLGSERTMDYYVRRWDDPDSDSDSDGEGKQESREDIWAYILTQCEKRLLLNDC